MPQKFDASVLVQAARDISRKRAQKAKAEKEKGVKLAVVKDPVAKMKKGGSVKPAVVKEKVAAMKKGGEVKGLTAKQKAKLPKALQEAILKKRGLKK